jgi:hypothetical protein
MVFQTLEKYGEKLPNIVAHGMGGTEKFPMVGKCETVFSNVWKTTVFTNVKSGDGGTRVG